MRERRPDRDRRGLRQIHPRPRPRPIDERHDEQARRRGLRDRPPRLMRWSEPRRLRHPEVTPDPQQERGARRVERRRPDPRPTTSRPGSGLRPRRAASSRHAAALLESARSRRSGLAGHVAPRRPSRPHRQHRDRDRRSAHRSLPRGGEEPATETGRSALPGRSPQGRAGPRARRPSRAESWSTSTSTRSGTTRSRPSSVTSAAASGCARSRRFAAATSGPVSATTLSLDPPFRVIARRSSGSSGRVGMGPHRPVAYEAPFPHGAHRPGGAHGEEKKRFPPGRGAPLARLRYGDATPAQNGGSRLRPACAWPRARRRSA